MSDLMKTMLTDIETELIKQVSRLDAQNTHVYHDMLTYHMGWSGDGAGQEATGKRIRPLMVLLVCAACCRDIEDPTEATWRSALPAAAAVELVHNFSLVHDDIQDNSEKRRGRPTVWVKWGIPQAINAGDGLFVLANQAITDLLHHYSAEIVVKVSHILQNTCLDLTRGQFLDMSYQKRNDLRVDDYWPMVGGKTAALLSCCCTLGAILGGADEATMDAYRSFGHYLGLAFQLQDDILGIWGNEAVTGKSIVSDLVEGKKSLPVLVGLSKNGLFSERWKKDSIRTEEVQEIATLLANEGGYAYTHDLSVEMTDLAINCLREADPQGDAGECLTKLANQLIKRGA